VQPWQDERVGYLREMELRQLRYFLAVAEERNLTRPEFDVRPGWTSHRPGSRFCSRTKTYRSQISMGEHMKSDGFLLI
jgi:hypothetical protein